MAAFDARVLEPRQTAEHRQARLALEHRRERPAEGGGALVEEHARDVAGRAEVAQPAELGGQGQARCARGQHQQDGQVQRIGELPRARARRHAAEAVVQAHRALDHRRAVTPAGAGKERPDALRTAQKQIEVVAFDPEDGAVEHRVDVIRPALEGAGGVPALLQNAQQGAGRGGLAAAGRGRGDQQADHRLSSRRSPPGRP